MRVALFATDDSWAQCLEPLIAQGCAVLGIGAGAGDMRCSLFARRCVELGLEFSSLSDVSISKQVVESFKPDVIILTLGHGPPPKAFEEVTPLSESLKLVVRTDCNLPEAPTPEFAPIWLEKDASLISLVPAGGGAPLCSVSVPIGPDESALTLRFKHADATAELLARIVEGNYQKTAESPARVADNENRDSTVPRAIALDWDEATVERFIRARFFPPRDVAVVADPVSEDVYQIESLEQYREFRAKVLRSSSAQEEKHAKAYAADTHWYSNIGGSIVRMGDSDIHKPMKVSERKRASVVPGAALEGRKKLRMNEPLIGPNAERYCAKALDSSWIGVEGPYVKRFERQLAQICGCNAACAVQSGTAALYGAMKALGVSDPSHHVLCPSFTCAACADAVVHAGGLPIPIDCELDSFSISHAAVKAALEGDADVVGVVIAPCYGVPSRDFNEILALCKERGIWLCEDACESYGGMKLLDSSEGCVSKVPIGSQATLSVVSVRSEKMVGVGEGGAILGNDATLVARAKWWCSRAPTRGGGLWRVYEHDAVGQNFRLPEMLAAVGSAAAEMLPLMIERKRAIHAWYEEEFAASPDLRSLKLQKCNPGDEAVWWITCALLPEGLSGEKVGMQLMKSFPDIEIRPGFFPLENMQIFQSQWSKPCPNSNLLYNRLVCLPSSNRLQKPDISRVCGALAEALRTVNKDSEHS